MKKYLISIACLLGSVNASILAVPTATQTASSATATAPTAKELTMPVRRVVHKNAVKKDAVTAGTFTWKKGGTMTMVFSETDKLLMEGKTYTIVMGSRRQVASGENATMFGVMQQVVDNFLAGGDGHISAAASKGAVITYAEGCITIVPDASIKKNRLLFTSFVINVDSKQHQLRSIRMMNRGKDNYTTYEF